MNEIEPPTRAQRSITERADFRVWTIAMITLTFAAVIAAVAAVAISRDAKDSGAKSSSAAGLAKYPGQTVDFNAEPPPGFEARDPNAPPTPGGRTHNITLRMKEKKVSLAPGVSQTVWTFGGTVPGPTYRAKVGDTFNFTIINDGEVTHSMDFHSGMVSPSTAMVAIDPGKSHTYSYRANKPGIYMYHCGTPPVLMHIATGMYGAVIVDPPDLPEVDREFVMVQSDLYTGAKGALPEMGKLLDAQYDIVAFNGYSYQYKHRPIRVEPNERIRVWVLDDGPSQVSSFHVIGTIFDTVYKEGNYLLRPEDGGGAQALDLMPAQGGFVEFQPTEPGMYPFVTHKFDDASKGAIGVFQVGDVEGAGSH